MQIVYILRSKIDQEKLYIGSTENLEARLNRHNKGKVSYSRLYRPWEIEWSANFKNKETAFRFEKYLKSGSGHAFLKKRLLP